MYVTFQYLENDLEKFTTRLSKEVCTRGKNRVTNQLDTKTIVIITNLQKDNHEANLTIYLVGFTSLNNQFN